MKNPLQIVQALLGQREKIATDLSDLRHHANNLREQKERLLVERRRLLDRPVQDGDLKDLFARGVAEAKRDYPQKLAHYLKTYSGLRTPSVETLTNITDEAAVRIVGGTLTCDPHLPVPITQEILLALTGDTMLPALQAAIEQMPRDRAGEISLSEARKQLRDLDAGVATIDSELAEIERAVLAFGETP